MNCLTYTKTYKVSYVWTYQLKSLISSNIFPKDETIVCVKCLWPIKIESFSDQSRMTVRTLLFWPNYKKTKYFYFHIRELLYIYFKIDSYKTQSWKHFKDFIKCFIKYFFLHCISQQLVHLVYLQFVSVCFRSIINQTCKYSFILQEKKITNTTGFNFSIPSCILSDDVYSRTLPVVNKNLVYYINKLSTKTFWRTNIKIERTRN